MADIIEGNFCAYDSPWAVSSCSGAWILVTIVTLQLHTGMQLLSKEGGNWLLDR